MLSFRPSARRSNHVVDYKKKEKKRKKKRTRWIVNFAAPANHKVKLKESEKWDKYLDLAGKLKKLWNMKVTMIPIVIVTHGIVTKGLIQRLEDLEIRERVETFQNTSLLKTARILRSVLEIWGDLLSLKVQWKPINLRGCEKLSNE